ncbi:MAG: Translation elongation factor LepA, partial [uncultured Rubrobacteraceae bacterium]
DKYRAYAQLLHNSAHRSWQEHVGRPTSGHHRGGSGAGSDGSDPGYDGYRAGAGYHDQGPGRPGPVPSRRWRVDPEPYRHPWARGLRLRGLARHRRVRGGAPRGGREPGHPGPDARQPVSGDGARPGDHPGPQQDRPPHRRRAHRDRGARRASGYRRGRDTKDLRQDRRGRHGGPRRYRGSRPHPEDHPGGDTGARLRLLLRPVPGRGLAGPPRRRRAQEGRRGQGDGFGGAVRAPGGRLLYAQADGAARSARRRGRLRNRRPEGYRGPARRRHGDAGRGPGRAASTWLRPGAADGLFGALPDGGGRLRAAQGGSGEAAAKRRFALLRAGELADGVRLPVRVPRAPSHGDHPGEVGEGVRPGPHRLVAERALRGGGGRRGRGDHQPERPAGVFRGDPGARRAGDPDLSEGVCRRGDGPLPRAARGLGGDGVYLDAPGTADLRSTARGDHHGFFRRFEEPNPRLRLVRLRVHGLRGCRPRKGRGAGLKRAGGRALDHRPPRQGVLPRPGAYGEAQGAHPAPAVRGAGASDDGEARDRTRDRPCLPQGRDGEVLRRGHHPQAQAPRAPEGRQAPHEAGRERGDTAGSVPRGAQDL